MNKFYEEIMEKCITLALKGKGSVEPNPMVGCVLTDGIGNVLTFGYHQKYGENHAERNALINYNQKIPCDAVLFVNLEPCSHFGKTPPCADLIIQKGIKNVVIGMLDPNPLVMGRGVEKLQNAGINVKIGVLEEKAKDLNKVFIKNIMCKKPYVMLKTATTMDGKIATNSGSSKWITNTDARNDVMQMRSEYDAIMTGSGTVLFDNPMLTSRIENGKNPARIIMDRQGKIPLDKNVFNNDGIKVFIITNSTNSYPSHITKIAYDETKGFDGLFKELYKHKIYKVMVEGGSVLNSALIRACEVDEINQFIAPKILGCGLDFVDGFNVENINNSVKLRGLNCKKIGPDILLSAKFVYDKE